MRGLLNAGVTFFPHSKQSHIHFDHLHYRANRHISTIHFPIQTLSTPVYDLCHQSTVRFIAVFWYPFHALLFETNELMPSEREVISCGGDN